MRTETHGEVLLVTELSSLTADNARYFKELTCGTLKPEHRVVEVDVSAARVLDSEGLGALISVHKRMCEQEGCIRLLNPTPFVEELIVLLRLSAILPTVRR
jgi:anti-anti-sigma regulatory factor